MRLDLVEKRAYKLLEELKINQLPIPVEKIAKKLGIEIHEEEFENELSGVLYRDQNQVVIGVNKLHHEKRKRFTIAHEIGHFILHKGNPIHIDKEFFVNFRDATSSQATNIEEIEANTFAAALLMPKELVKKELANIAVDGIDPFQEETEIISELSRKFRVSHQSLCIRLGKLGLL
ncbi:hypothetical protein CBW65_07475 [Tumebacillus avium]|uniref:IrrE N-terminal-like domain-containing protein n=1 Tax=Tumebacillus avium TaxID=1903704 RepID=A0A1Y0IKY7_9BACL|nr:ImmA/IrrE family metallo-endopeptidase [Tumebacillus avium]ARU60940.1 hypothetical protein CBW65_07475 [Tumebacillus avium]